MRTTSPPILIYQPGGGVPVGPVSNPPVYSQHGTTQLVAGQSYVDVVFGSVQTTDEWVLVECIVVNEIDVDPLNIWPGIITDKIASGFRLQLNGMPDSSNYYLHWAVSGINITPVPATSYLLSGPSTGAVGVASTFTVSLPPSTTFSAVVTITPNDGGGGGAFSPANVTLLVGSASATFTYTPASYGAKTISVTNSGTLTNPASIVITPVATTYTLSGPSSGNTGAPSTNFTVALPVGGVVIGTVMVTPSDGGDGGTFTPTTVGMTTVAPSATFTYTPASGGDKTISVTNNGGLTDPGNLTYTVIVLVQHLLDTLISYWKLDEASTGAGAVNRADSHGTNDLSESGANLSSATGKIGNGVSIVGGPGILARTDNSDIRVTSDFTFSIWLKLNNLTGQQTVVSKDAITAPSVRDYNLYYDGSLSSFFFMVAGDDPNAASASFATASVWVHLVAWYQSSDQKTRIRVNDATTYVGAAASSALVQSTANFIIGARQYGPSPGYFDGVVDEVGFWKRVLTADEMSFLYNGGAGNPYSSFSA